MLNYQAFKVASTTAIKHFAILPLAGCVLATMAVAQSAPGALTSRAELTAAEISLTQSRNGDPQKNALLAAAIRQGLRDGDFQLRDPGVVTVGAKGTPPETA